MRVSTPRTAGAFAAEKGRGSMHTSTPRRRSKIVAVTGFVAALTAAAATLHASGSGPPKQEETPKSEAQAPSQSAKPYDRGMDLVESEQFAEARKVFEQLAVEEPKNAEVLNMLAYTQRKTGDIDEAIANYGRALQLKPKFPQAREYLAEAYLQAALREAKTLQSYGDDGRGELRKLADAFQEAHSQIETGGGKGSKSAGSW
jgi:predicted Zn-dependent protease